MSLEHITEGLRPLAVLVSSLIPDPLNARKHNKRNLDTIRTSFERYGQVKPIAVRKSDNVVLCGNGRLQVAKELGWTHIAAVLMTGTDAELSSFAILDNQSSDLAEWDEATLADVLTTIAQEDESLLQGIGFNQSELDAFIDTEDVVGDLSNESLTQFEQPEQQPQGTKDEGRPQATPTKGLNARGSRRVEGSVDGRSGDSDEGGKEVRLSNEQALSLRGAQESLSQEKETELSEGECIRILCRRYLKTKVDQAEDAG